MRPTRWTPALCLMLVLALAGCGGKKSADSPPESSLAKPSTASSSQPAPPAARQDGTDSSQGDVALARVLVVDMEGKPLPNMAPIATLKPNAFDKPLATGQLTGTDGRGYVTIPRNQLLCVRAWDPTQRLFANNYFDVLPGDAPTTDEMRIVMLPGASLDAVLVSADGKPLANVNIGMMMSHPTRGPWWPAESKTNALGAVHFASVPAGKYQVTLEAATGQHIDLPEVALPPGGNASLGTVALQ